MAGDAHRRRIALFQPYPHTLGGLQLIVLQLARGLPSIGCEAVLLVPEPGKFAERAREERLEIIVIDPGPAWRVYGRGARSLSYALSPWRITGLLRYWLRLGRELHAAGIDLLHCNDYRAVLLAAPAARLAGIPVLWHMHGFIPSRAANAICAALAHWIVPVSAGMLAYLPGSRRWFRKSTVIHNGLELAAAEATAPDLAGTQPVVLAVGTLHPRKGYETLLHAFQHVAKAVPDAECWIVGGEFGDASYGAKLRALAASLGVAERVKFHGSSDRVAAFMERSTVLAVPSRVEAFGMVALEAMRARRPVVACRTGGLQEIVADGETGLLVGPSDGAAMASALTQLLRDPATAKRMGDAGRARLEREFPIGKMLESFAQLYTAMIKSRRTE